MARAPMEITLVDGEGVSHDYRIMLHPHQDGAALVTDLLCIVGPTAARGVFEAFRAAANNPDLQPKGELTPEAATELARLQNVAMLNALSGIDIPAVMQASLNTFAQKGGLQALGPRLLAYTFRDGVALNRQTAIDMAYAGNYGEEMQALRAVMDFNGFYAALSTWIG